MATTNQVAGTVAGFEALRELMGEDGIRELITIFIEDGGAHLDALVRALARRDAGLLAKEAHALRGSSATMGASQMATLCAQLEQRGRQGTTDGADSLLESLADEFNLVTSVLAKTQQN